MNAPASFRKNGFLLNLKEQNGAVALYEASTREGGPRGWEVIILRPARNVSASRSFPVDTHGVRLPSNEEFGTWGWSFQTEAAARRKLEILQQPSEQTREPQTIELMTRYTPWTCSRCGTTWSSERQRCGCRLAYPGWTP